MIVEHHSGRYLLTHRELLWRVMRNELAARHAGSLLGRGWVILSPLVILLIYAVVYLFIFRVRVPGLSPLQYVLYTAAGLAPFLAAAEALSLGVGSIVANKFVMTASVFPLDLVPVKAVLTSQSAILVGVGLILATNAATGALSWASVLIPVLWILYVMALIGVAWVLSLLNIVFRDLQSLIGLLLTIVMIASPIGYTPEMVPPALKPLILLNPFAYFVTAYQQLLVVGRVPGLLHWMVLVLVAVTSFVVGGWFFGRAKHVLVDYV